MAGILRALRRPLLTPNNSAALLSSSGSHEKEPAARELLESVGEIFLMSASTSCGHTHGQPVRRSRACISEATASSAPAPAPTTMPHTCDSKQVSASYGSIR